MEESAVKRSVLVAASLASFLVPYTTSSITVALPAIGDQFHLDPASLGWITTAYIFACAVFIIPVGRLADIHGRKRYFIAGTLIFTIGSALCALAPSADWLIAFRVFQGIGGACLFATSVAIITDIFPPGERGHAIGLVTATIYGGLSIGPFIGGTLTQYFGWRSIFLVIVPLGAVAIALTCRRVHGEWRNESGRFDIAGAGIYMGMVFCLMHGLTILPSPEGVVFRCAGIMLTPAFTLWERRARSPLLTPGLFRENMTFTLSNIAAMINYGATFAVGFLLSLYFQYVRAFDPLVTGLILVSQPVVQMLLSPAAGKLSDTVEPRIVASTGMAVTAVGLIPLVFISSETPLPVILASLLLLGIGYALFSSPNTNAIMSSVDRKYLGIASGMVATMRTIGMVASVAVAMISFSVFIGTSVMSQALTVPFLDSIRVAFMVFTLLCLVGILASYSRGSVRRTGQETG